MIMKVMIMMIIIVRMMGVDFVRGYYHYGVLMIMIIILVVLMMTMIIIMVMTMGM